MSPKPNMAKCLPSLVGIMSLAGRASVLTGLMGKWSQDARVDAGLAGAVVATSTMTFRPKICSEKKTKKIS